MVKVISTMLSQRKTLQSITFWEKNWEGIDKNTKERKQTKINLNEKTKFFFDYSRDSKMPI